MVKCMHPEKSRSQRAPDRGEARVGPPLQYGHERGGLSQPEHWVLPLHEEAHQVDKKKWQVSMQSM